jgi:hypothetical protein
MKKTRAIPERAKPFRLVKYFSFSSLFLIFLGTIVLSVLNTHWIRSMQYEKSEDYPSCSLKTSIIKSSCNLFFQSASNTEK